MARTCYLKDGRIEVILEDLDIFLERIIRENLGDDVAIFFRLYIEETEAELKSVAEESECYERSADEYRSMCCDARDAFENIIDLLDEPRLNRNDLMAVAQNGYNDLNNNL